MTSLSRLFADEATLPREPDVCGAAIDLINKDVSPTKSISLATIFIEAGKASRPHYHKVMEEIYYFIEGEGEVIIGSEVFAVKPGVAVAIPVGALHQVVNRFHQPLKFLSADSPSFDPTDLYFA